MQGDDYVSFGVERNFILQWENSHGKMYSHDIEFERHKAYERYKKTILCRSKQAFGWSDYHH
jgi:hypothetical protein